MSGLRTTSGGPPVQAATLGAPAQPTLIHPSLQVSGSVGSGSGDAAAVGMTLSWPDTSVGAVQPSASPLAQYDPLPLIFPSGGAALLSSTSDSTAPARNGFIGASGGDCHAPSSTIVLITALLARDPEEVSLVLEAVGPLAAQPAHRIDESTSVDGGGRMWGQPRPVFSANFTLLDVLQAFSVVLHQQHPGITVGGYTAASVTSLLAPNAAATTSTGNEGSGAGSVTVAVGLLLPLFSQLPRRANVSVSAAAAAAAAVRGGAGGVGGARDGVANGSISAGGVDEPIPLLSDPLDDPASCTVLLKLVCSPATLAHLMDVAVAMEQGSAPAPTHVSQALVSAPPPQQAASSSESHVRSVEGGPSGGSTAATAYPSLRGRGESSTTMEHSASSPHTSAVEVSSPQLAVDFATSAVTSPVSSGAPSSSSGSNSGVQSSFQPKLPLPDRGGGGKVGVGAPLSAPLSSAFGTGGVTSSSLHVVGDDGTSVPSDQRVSTRLIARSPASDRVIDATQPPPGFVDPYGLDIADAEAAEHARAASDVPVDSRGGNITHTPVDAFVERPPWVDSHALPSDVTSAAATAAADVTGGAAPVFDAATCGFDVYVDGARFLPDNVSVSKVGRYLMRVHELMCAGVLLRYECVEY